MTEQTGAPAPAGFTYSVDRGTGSTVTLKVEVDRDRLAAAADRVFGRRVREAKIPGFRPGKAPRALYERTYGREPLWHEGAEDVIEETYREIVQREDLHPIGTPTVDHTDVEPERPFSYTLTVPVRPEVALGDTAAHGVVLEPRAVTDEDVERTIAGMREHHAELRPVDRAAAKGDVLTLDIDADLDGRTVTMARQGHLELGRDYAVPGLADSLVGVTGGEERKLEVTFPDDHPDEQLRGKKGVFTTKVSQVSEKILPDLDDSFAKTVGVGTLAELRRAVRNELAHGSFHEARDEAAEKVMDHLLSVADVDVPEILVQDELGHMLAQLKDRISQQGMSYEQFLLQARKTEDDIRGEWREAALRRAKALLVLDAVAKKENVTVSGAELAQEVGAMPLAQQDARALRDPVVLASLARSIRNRKVVDKLIGLDTPDAEREAIRKAGGTDEPAEPQLVVPESAPEHTEDSREAIRSLLQKK
ncbi:MAG TPA: trigger factor [Candidatus Limnocylindria bacterium]|nr:trigger factor [Candidatus Limnocylindria bacterium]